MADATAADATATLELLERGLDQAERLVAEVTVDDLDRPTPCAEWAVRELLRHMVGGLRSFRSMAEGAGMTSFEVTVEDSELTSAYREAARALQDAWRAEGALDRRLTLFGRQVPAVMPLSLQLTETAVHTWDLASATGRHPQLDPAVAERALAFTTANMGAEQRGRSFGPEREAPAGAGPYERLAAFAGRDVAPAG